MYMIKQVQYYRKNYVRNQGGYIILHIDEHQVRCYALKWRHNGRNSVSNHQHHDCLLNRLFRLRSKKTSKLRVTGLCAGNSPGPVNSPHKGPVTRKMVPFDDVIMFIVGGYWSSVRSFLRNKRTCLVIWIMFIFNRFRRSLQHSCGDICQIWAWFSIENQCFDDSENLGN